MQKKWEQAAFTTAARTAVDKAQRQATAKTAS